MSKEKVAIKTKVQKMPPMSSKAQIENTSPDNGRIMVNKRLLSKSDFIKFLRFELQVEPAPLHEIKPKA